MSELCQIFLVYNIAMVKRRILIVEDEWLNARYISQILTKLSCEVIGVASSYKECMQLLEQSQPEFIFMDINLSYKEDGITLSSMIATRYDIPIIYMTAYGNSQTINEASRTNMYGFLIKPFSEVEVEATLQVAIQQYERGRFELSPQSSSRINLHKHCYYDTKSRGLYCYNRCINLSKIEQELMQLFVDNIGAPLPLSLIKERIWEQKSVGDSTVRDAILRLRKKIEPLTIETITNIGYILKRGS